jgi:hypothetical protein
MQADLSCDRSGRPVPETSACARARAANRALKALSTLAYVAVGVLVSYGASLLLGGALLAALALLERLARRGNGAAPHEQRLVNHPGQAAAIRRLATWDVSAMFGVRRLEHALSRLLEPDEAVLALASSTLAGRWWEELRSKKSGRLVVATDRRLLLVSSELLLARHVTAESPYPQPDSLPYGDIEDVEVKLGRLESWLKLSSTAGTIHLSSMRAKGASAVAAQIESLVGEVAGGPAA